MPARGRRARGHQEAARGPRSPRHVRGVGRGGRGRGGGGGGRFPPPPGEQRGRWGERGPGEPGRRGAPAVEAVKRASFTLDRGETLALVGESGSGKSVTALSILQLLPYPAAAHTRESSIRFAGEELVGGAPSRLREIRGNRIAMIFQEPMTSLNPLHTLEKQIGETLLIHKHMSGSAARARTLELLRQVGLRDAESRLGAYPHQLSGGQRQRVMIAMAIANEPDILIAD